MFVRILCRNSFLLPITSIALLFPSKSFADKEKSITSTKVQPWSLHLPSMPWANQVPDEAYAHQKTLPVEQAILTTAPNVPPRISRRHPVLLKVDLTTELKKIQLDSRYKYEAWTFNGSVPGPMIRARVGDVVELSLTNLDTSGNPHNIDCHVMALKVLVVEQH
jgi:FtsP/CotA-like multicopper oxidase with cupredoxin domain